MGSSEVTRVMAAAVTAGTKGGVEQRYQQPDYIDVSGGLGLRSMNCLVLE